MGLLGGIDLSEHHFLAGHLGDVLLFLLGVVELHHFLVVVFGCLEGLPRMLQDLLTLFFIGDFSWLDLDRLWRLFLLWEVLWELLRQVVECSLGIWIEVTVQLVIVVSLINLDILGELKK